MSMRILSSLWLFVAMGYIQDGTAEGSLSLLLFLFLLIFSALPFCLHTAERNFYMSDNSLVNFFIIFYPPREFYKTLSQRNGSCMLDERKMATRKASPSIH